MTKKDKISVVLIGSGPSSIFEALLLMGYTPEKPLDNLSSQYWPSNFIRKKPTISFVKMDSNFRVTILGDHIGGIWKNDDMTETISYGWQLELPQLPLQDYLNQVGIHVKDFQFYRPSRSLISKYYHYIVEHFNIKFISCNVYSTTKRKFVFETMTSKGVFTSDKTVITIGKYTVPKRLSFDSSFTIPMTVNESIRKVMVIGSGFSAADAVLQYLKWGVTVYHVFYAMPHHIKSLNQCLHRHDLKIVKSPLEFCHSSSYPAYANLYQQMKTSKCCFNSKSTQSTGYIPLAGFEAISENQVLDPCGNLITIDVDHTHTLIGYHDFQWSNDGNTVYFSKSDLFFKHPLGRQLTINNLYICGSADGSTLIRDCFDSCYTTYKRINEEETVN